jgi:hypothetical protein
VYKWILLNAGMFSQSAIIVYLDDWRCRGAGFAGKPAPTKMLVSPRAALGRKQPVTTDHFRPKAAFGRVRITVRTGHLSKLMSDWRFLSAVDTVEFNPLRDKVL